MPPVHHHGELDDPRTPPLRQGVEGRADGAPGEEHVVDQHDHLVGQVTGDRRGRRVHQGAHVDIITPVRHVEGARADRGRTQFGELGGDGRGEGDPAGLQANHDERVAGVVLENLVAHAS